MGDDNKQLMVPAEKTRGAAQTAGFAAVAVAFVLILMRLLPAG